MQNRASPLYVASQQGHKDVALLLIGKGAAVDTAIIVSPCELLLSVCNQRTLRATQMVVMTVKREGMSSAPQMLIRGARSSFACICGWCALAAGHLVRLHGCVYVRGIRSWDCGTGPAHIPYKLEPFVRAPT